MMSRADWSKNMGSSAMTPDTRTLYLGSVERKRVDSTGDALVVRNNRAQTMRFPFARVSRIISSTNVDWTGAALAHCLQRGIAISWMDVHRDLIGTCYPCNRQYQPLDVAIVMWLEAPNGYEGYQNWLRSRRMDVLIRSVQPLAQRPTAAQWEFIKKEWVYCGRVIEHLPRNLQSQLLAYVGAQMAVTVVAPFNWDVDNRRIDLDVDLCRLLWAEMNMSAGSLADAITTDKEIAEFFERWITCNGAALVLHLNSLHRTAMRAITTLT